MDFKTEAAGWLRNGYWLGEVDICLTARELLEEDVAASGCEYLLGSFVMSMIRKKNTINGRCDRWLGYLLNTLGGMNIPNRPLVWDLRKKLVKQSTEVSTKKVPSLCVLQGQIGFLKTCCILPEYRDVREYLISVCQILTAAQALTDRKEFADQQRMWLSSIEPQIGDLMSFCIAASKQSNKRGREDEEVEEVNVSKKTKKDDSFSELDDLSDNLVDLVKKTGKKQQKKKASFEEMDDDLIDMIKKVGNKKQQKKQQKSTPLNLTTPPESSQQKTQKKRVPQPLSLGYPPSMMGIPLEDISLQGGMEMY